MKTDDLSPMTNLNIMENIEQLLTVQSKIQTIESKISMQKEEIEKTLNLIEQFKSCYEEQSEALVKFEAERIKFLKEHDLLVESQKISNKNISDIIDQEKIINQDNISNYKSDNIKRSTNEEVLSKPVNSTNTKGQLTQSKNQKLKRKNTPPNHSKKGSEKKKKVNKDSSSNKQTVVTESTNCKTSHKPESIISVLVKVDTWPLETVTSVKDDCVIQRINANNNEDLLMCGSRGLLNRHQKMSIMYYCGHYKKTVQNLYICSNEKLLSIGPNYAMINKLNEIKGRNITTFTPEICCTCMYKNKVYGILKNGSIFIIESKSEKVHVYPNVIKEQHVISIIIVKLDHTKLLITANTKNEVASYSLDESNWLNLINVVRLNDNIKGLINFSSDIICYTTHFIFLIDKPLAKISLLREITNEIMFLDVGMNTVIVLDNYNILHKYLIKKGKVKPGSTVENLPLNGTATAMSFNYLKKMIYFAKNEVLFCQKF